MKIRDTDELLNSPTRLIFVRHSQPKIIPDWPSNTWCLSDTGRNRCRLLAPKVAGYQPDIIISSNEIKAMETGMILAECLGKPFKTADGLHEHDRSNVGYFDSVEHFELQVENFFRNPKEPVYGRETAEQAYRRFSQAVQNVLIEYPDQSIVLVSHGTVMTLFTAHMADLDPFPLWKSLGLPALVVFALPSFKLLEIMERIEEPTNL